jgi:hypothetical protein
MVVEKKDKLNEKNKDMEPFRDELTLLHISLYIEKVKKRTKRKLKFMRNKLIARKKKEAFPRKSGKYNELFQDLAKESGNRDNPVKTT